METKMKFERYSKYKDSGVEWLGEIPGHWELTRLGTRFEERRTKVSDKDFLALSVTKNGIVPQLESAAKTNDGDNRKLVMKGDFVINSRSDRKGSSGIAFQDGSVSLINIVIEPEEINPSYCNFLLKSYAFIEEFYRMGHGIVADLWTTRYSEMKNIKIGIPTLDEQVTIANFLENKCEKIDTAVKQKENLIKLLKEQKQIIIQNAVTKGIETNRKMKDSGVEWIGEIPEEWEVSRFKYCCSIRGGQVDPKKEKFASRILIAPNHVQSRTGKILKLETAKKQGADSGKYLIEKNDIIYSKIRPALRKVCISTIDGLCSADMYAISTKKSINKEYLLYFMLTEVFSIQAINSAMRVSIPKVNRETLNEFIIFVPIFREQQQIVKYIEEKSSKIDKSIKLQEKQIEKLKEYKETLIDSAVTGKIRV